MPHPLGSVQMSHTAVQGYPLTWRNLKATPERLRQSWAVQIDPLWKKLLQGSQSPLGDHGLCSDVWAPRVKWRAMRVGVPILVLRLSQQGKAALRWRSLIILLPLIMFCVSAIAGWNWSFDLLLVFRLQADRKPFWGEALSVDKGMLFSQFINK